MIVAAPHRVWYTVPHGPCNPTHWSACKLYVNIIFGTSVISPFTGVTPSSIQHWNIGREKTLACARKWPLPQRGVIGNPIKRKCHAGNCVSQCESSARGGSQWTQGRGDMWRRSLTASVAPCPSRAPSAAARLRFHSLPLWSHRLHLTLPIAESQSSIRWCFPCASPFDVLKAPKKEKNFSQIKIDATLFGCSSCKLWKKKTPRRSLRAKSGRCSNARHLSKTQGPADEAEKMWFGF